MNSTSDVPLVCIPDAMNAQQRVQYQHALGYLQKHTERVEELPNGYTFHYQHSAPGTLLATVAEYVSLERLCCPFFHFNITLTPQGNVNLSMTGQEGTKEFLRSQM
jgi:hypothetical protein